MYKKCKKHKKPKKPKKSNATSSSRSDLALMRVCVVLFLLVDFLAATSSSRSDVTQCVCPCVSNTFLLVDFLDA